MVNEQEKVEKLVRKIKKNNLNSCKRELENIVLTSKNSETMRYLIIEASETENLDCVQCVIASTTTDPQILEKLSQNKNPICRLKVAENKKTPRKILLAFKKDKCFFIREAAKDTLGISKENFLIKKLKNFINSIKCSLSLN